MNQRCEAEMETVRGDIFFYYFFFFLKNEAKAVAKDADDKIRVCVCGRWQRQRWGEKRDGWRTRCQYTDFTLFFSPLGGKCPEQISSDRCYTSWGAKDRGYHTPLNYLL